MANVKFLTGTYSQYSALAVKDANTLYFVDGQLFKGSVSYSDQIAVVSALPDTLVAGKVYVNTTDKSVTYYDGTNSTVVVPATVGIIGDSTPDTDLANVKAIKDFVTAEITKASANYTVTLVDEEISVGEKSKQTLKQGTGDKEKTIGTIVVPDLKMEVKAIFMLTEIISLLVMDIAQLTGVQSHKTFLIFKKGNDLLWQTFYSRQEATPSM